MRSFVTLCGLGDQCRWAREHAFVFGPSGAAGLSGWHLKPFALLRAPWRDSLRLDLDCRVLRKPAEIIDAGLAFGLTHDPDAKLSRPNPWGTGVVVVRRGEPAERLIRHVLVQGLFWEDGGILWFGARGERAVGKWNFMDLLALITSAADI